MSEWETTKNRVPTKVDKIVEEMSSIIDNAMKEGFPKDVKKILEGAKKALLQIKKEHSNGDS